MGTVTKPHTFTTGGTILASEVNADFDTLYTLVNGNIEAANIASGAVGQSELASSAVTNAKVDASAAIALSKLAALTASRATETDASGFITASSVTSTELGYVSGVTSAIQTQLDAKAETAADAGAVADGGDSITTLYAGRITSTGTAATLPTGWSFTRVRTGEYTITHSLGTSSYQVVATPSVPSSAGIAYVETKGTNSFTVQLTDTSATAFDGNIDFLVTA